MKSNPLWIEQFLDDKDLYEFFIQYLSHIESLPKELEHVIDLGKKDTKVKNKNMIQEYVFNIIPASISIADRLLVRFKQNNFLSSSMIESYEQTIKQIKDKILEITIRENLSQRE